MSERSWLEEQKHAAELAEEWQRLNPGVVSHPFASNFSRLLGFHNLTSAKASKLLGISTTTLSYWRNGHRLPDLSSAILIGELFEVDVVQLTTMPFVSLIQNELADVSRFIRVEKKIQESLAPKKRAKVVPFGKKAKT